MEQPKTIDVSKRIRLVLRKLSHDKRIRNVKKSRSSFYFRFQTELVKVDDTDVSTRI